MNDTKEQFMKTWNNLVDSIENLRSVTEANRRLLAGITTLLIEKEILTPNEVKDTEEQVVKAIKKPVATAKKKKRRRRKKTNDIRLEKEKGTELGDH